MESSSEVLSNIVEDLPENAKSDKQSVDEEVTVTVKKPAELDNDNVEKAVKDTTEDQQSSAEQAEVEEIVEVIEEEDDNDGDDGDEGEEGIKREIAQDNTEIADGSQTKSITVTTVKKVEPDSSTRIVVDISNVAKENVPVTTTSEERKMKASEGVVRPGTQKQEQQPKQEKEDEEVVEEEETENEEEVENLEKQNELKKLHDSSASQELKQDQILQEPETTPLTAVKEETVVDASSSAVPPTSQHESNISDKQENFNSTIKDIISSIDSNIKAEENIAVLKEREMELLKRQQQLEKEIEQQQLLAQKLANKNLLNQQFNNNLINQENIIPPQTYQPITNAPKYSTFEEKQDNNVYSRKSETFESRESTNVSKKVDLNKIFTPATDTEEILPKNRKLYASSAFYSPTLHPTVEDQVELARRISHSLSDISNHQSRGQSMYVNRKKRSVKWVHEGCGQDGTQNQNNIKIKYEEEYDLKEMENGVDHHEKVPLKFLMNPCGQMRDINSLRESINTETGLLSPDVSAEVVTALQAQKGKGAELFAKRRKVSEKWVVDESNVGVQSPSGLPDYHQYQQQPKPSTSPSILPAYTDAAKHRVQLNLHQEQLLEKYAKPGLKVVQTPWEAALNSGSASAAFVEEQKLSPYLEPILTPSPTPQIFDASQGAILFPCGPIVDSYSKSYTTGQYQIYSQHAAPQQQGQHKLQPHSGSNSKRELAYKPNIPQGWKAPSMSLPKDLYMPKEIPQQSYAPPPAAVIASASSPFAANAAYETNQCNTYKPLNSSQMASYLLPETAPFMTKSYGGNSNTFPTSKPYHQGFSSTHGNCQPPKQQYFPPQSYQKVTQNTSQNIPQVSFNPSPLPYDKLAKFENQSPDECRYNTSSSSRASQFNVRGSKVRNISPAPFVGSYNRPYIPSSDGHYYTGTPRGSPRSLCSTQQFSEHNTPNISHPSVSSNQKFNAPSYNTSARGWGCSGGASTDYHYHSHMSAAKPKIINAASMPYTDF